MGKAIKWIAFALSCIGLIVVLVIFSKSQNSELNSLDQNIAHKANELNGNIGDRTIGNLDSDVILIEYADYQCPACAQFSPLILSVVNELKDKIGFIYRNYSLSYHTNSRAASATAQAAGLQGKFWEMHRLIYEKQIEWESLDIEERTDFFLKLGEELELDIDKLREDMASDAVSQKITFDQTMANKARIDATPTLFLNGKKIDLEKESIKNEDDLKNYINQAIESSTNK